MTTGERARRRQAYLAALLSPIGLTLADFSGATRGFLDEYARYALLALENPSASWDGAVVELCKAVETELAYAFRKCPGFRPLEERTALGEKARVLRVPNRAARSWLAARHLEVPQLANLAGQVSKLASIRSRCGAAHGGLEGRQATRSDHDRALKVGMTGDSAVLPMLVEIRRSAPRR